jgi:hypothetical protein
VILLPSFAHRKLEIVPVNYTSGRGDKRVEKPYNASF